MAAIPNEGGNVLNLSDVEFKDGKFIDGATLQLSDTETLHGSPFLVVNVFYGVDPDTKQITIAHITATVDSNEATAKAFQIVDISDYDTDTYLPSLNFIAKRTKDNTYTISGVKKLFPTVKVERGIVTAAEQASVIKFVTEKFGTRFLSVGAIVPRTEAPKAVPKAQPKKPTTKAAPRAAKPGARKQVRKPAAESTPKPVAARKRALKKPAA